MPPTIQLRDVVDADMPIFFAQQKEPAGVQMAAFTAKDPNDRAAFDSQWASIRADRGITLQTILYEEAVAGTILCHSWFGAPEISYWLGEAFWGKGIATAALQQFLKQVTIRPLLALVKLVTYRFAPSGLTVNFCAPSRLVASVSVSS